MSVVLYWQAAEQTELHNEIYIFKVCQAKQGQK